MRRTGIFEKEWSRKGESGIGERGEGELGEGFFPFLVDGDVLGDARSRAFGGKEITKERGRI